MIPTHSASYAFDDQKIQWAPIEVPGCGVLADFDFAPLAGSVEFTSKKGPMLNKHGHERVHRESLRAHTLSGRSHGLYGPPDAFLAHFRAISDRNLRKNLEIENSCNKLYKKTQIWGCINLYDPEVMHNVYEITIYGWMI